MMKREFFGEDTEQAQAKASAVLNIPVDKLNYESLPGTFGLTSKDRKKAIIVEYEEQEQVEAAPVNDDAELIKKIQELKDQPEACSELVVRKILKGMGLEVEAIQAMRDGDQIIISIKLVGDPIDMRRGESREFRGSLQYLVNRIVHEGREGEQRFIIDFGGQLEQRAVAMGELATQLADKALAIGQVLRIKLVESQDRRLLHLALEKDERVKTFSEGEGRFRVLCIQTQKKPEA